MKKKYQTLSPFLKGSTWNVVKGEGLVAAFTLIELMVVMTIMVILTGAMYTPFAHYKTKQKVRNSAKIITQVLNDARNSAIYWILNSTSTWNLDIWVKIKTWEDNLKIYWYPYNKTITDYEESDYFLEEIKLEPWVKINWTVDWYFIYKAITWSWIYKNFTPVLNKIELWVWFKWATTWTMTKKIEYYTKTYISDVK